MSRDQRRQFLIAFGTLLCAAASGFGAFTVPAHAQQAQRVFRVGVLSFGSAAPDPVSTPIRGRIETRLGELGFRQGRNLAMEYRWADANFDNVQPLTTDLARSGVDVIVTIGNKLVPLVTAANPRTPMVSLSCDPFSTVASYARPNGNFTGATCMSTELSPKRLEVAKALIPGARHVVYLHNPNQGATGLELTQKAAAQLGLVVQAVEMRKPEEREQAFAAIAAQRPDVLLVYPDAVTYRLRKEIADFALVQRLPSIYAYKEYAEAGGLVSYGSTRDELADRAAELVARILRGAKPHELPIEQAMRISLTVNMKSAAAMGIAIPQPLLLRADYVIE